MSATTTRQHREDPQDPKPLPRIEPVPDECDHEVLDVEPAGTSYPGPGPYRIVLLCSYEIRPQRKRRH